MRRSLDEYTRCGLPNFYNIINTNIHIGNTNDFKQYVDVIIATIHYNIQY